MTQRSEGSPELRRALKGIAEHFAAPTPGEAGPAVEATRVDEEKRIVTIVEAVFSHANDGAHQFRPKSCPGCAMIIPTLYGALPARPSSPPDEPFTAEDIEALNYAAYRIDAWAGPNDASAKRVRVIAKRLAGQP